MSSPKLVLKKFALGQTTADGPFLEIQGRAPGLTSFFLNLVGLDPTTYMVCYPNRIEVSQSGLAGKAAIIIPMTKVTSIQGGHSKPLAAFFLAVGFALTGLMGTLTGLVSGEGAAALGTGLMFFVLAGVLLAVYALSRTMTLHVQNGGDRIYGVTFGQGIIEGVAVDATRVQQAVDMLNRAVIAVR